MDFQKWKTLFYNIELQEKQDGISVLVWGRGCGCVWDMSLFTFGEGVTNFDHTV